MTPRVNKWLDLLDRVGWTVAYALAGALFVVLTESGFTWETGLKFVASQVVLVTVKVLIAQRTGSDETGSLLPEGLTGPVIEPPPQAESASATTYVGRR
jgi:hypothetical protein